MAASYRKGIEWVAENDEPNELNIGVVSEAISTMLLADLFQKDYTVVALQIVRFRLRRDIKTLSDKINFSTPNEATLAWLSSKSDLEQKLKNLNYRGVSA